ncbi:hypothetical protein G6O69_17930 [Pseudenhygromyxa sp. WMMC2535]|uniref:hypothetical protein n=1 Tax=Pseudenhygromyxa sp. WMMC2535 TaxID=2712867 RepID=UPI0015539672|nr:hypothetical protein [Pseudenhygromyxa sp. WMMC2535]NVB39728.1 hypothetical protein [Pseudenhygromyxa sp. WMMC2535]
MTRQQNAPITLPSLTSTESLQGAVDRLARDLEEGRGSVRPCWVVSQLSRKPAASSSTEVATVAAETSTLDGVAAVGRAIPQVAAWIWPRRQLILNELRSALAPKDEDHALFVRLDRTLERAAAQIGR